MSPRSFYRLPTKHRTRYVHGQRQPDLFRQLAFASRFLSTMRITTSVDANFFQTDFDHLRLNVPVKSSDAGVVFLNLRYRQYSPDFFEQRELYPRILSTCCYLPIYCRDIARVGFVKVLTTNLRRIARYAQLFSELGNECFQRSVNDFEDLSTTLTSHYFAFTMGNCCGGKNGAAG